jgi:Rrf2 family cysteine metabolism transcriptional repressor
LTQKEIYCIIYIKHIGLLGIGVDKMKLSTKGRYGLRAMLELAVRSNGGHVSLNVIAESQDISENYLEHVFSLLRKAGLVRSVKGAQGGYILARKPSDIKVGDILRALEGRLCVIEADNGPEENVIKRCIRENVWDKMNKKINDIVDSLTLEDLLNEYMRINSQEPLMYYI